MPANVVVIAGPSGSGKTAWLLARYRESLRTRNLGASLWISPTHRSAAEVRGQLLAGGLQACLRPAVMTFAQFAEHVVAASDQVVEPMTDLARRQLLRQLIRAAAASGRLRYFRPIAGTAGLTDLLVEMISELKRHEIWPDEFERACRERGPQPKDRELALLYEAYQRHLNENQLYDAEGRFWTARALLRDGKSPSFDALRCVVVDGFADFTRTQHEILALLAQRIETLHVSLALDAGKDRCDLFAKPRRTLEHLRRLHPSLSIEMLPRAARPSWPALAHVEAELFKSPRLVRVAEETARIEVIEAARAIDELYLVGRRIKRLLVEGDPDDRRPVRPGDVAVVLRSSAASATLVREAFDDLGLPYALDQGRPLAEAPIAAALVSMVRLHVEDWPFRRLLGLLASNYFSPDWPQWRAGGVAATADKTIRSLQIARGQSALIAALERINKEPTEPADPKSAAQHAAARETLALVRRLAEAFGRLPERATSSVWARALTALAAETGLTRAMILTGDDRFASADRAAWDLIIESATAAQRLTTGRDSAAAEFDAAEMLDVLTDIVSAARLREPNDETGRVRVLSATSARALSIPYLFFAGLSERAFPPPERADRLYSEVEYERLAAAGLPLVLRGEAGQEEMLLFYEVVTRARRRLYLSYPGLDDKGQPLLASPYLTELEHVLRGKAARCRVEDLSPIPRNDCIASLRDQRIEAVAHAAGIAGERTIEPARLLANVAASPASRSLFENLLAGLLAIHGRAAREGFGPFEGLLTGPAARERLAARFGPDVRWSASRLEKYRKCPYQFFLAEVLGIAPVEELSLATDHLARGSTLHDALARLHRELNQTQGRGISPAAPEATAAFHQAAETRLSEAAMLAERHALPFRRALAEIDRRLMRQWLDDYIDQHASYDALWHDFDDDLVPSHFEVTFGDDSPGDETLSSPEPLVLAHGEHRLLVRGRIDRIDLGRVAGSPVFNVLDYKTGQARGHAKKEIESGDALQAFLYVLAAEQLLARDSRLPWRTGYWFISADGYSAKQALAIHDVVDENLRVTEDWKALRDANIKRVIELVEAMRAGQFPVASRDEHCTSHCDFHTVCRINQVRALEKSWEPPILPS
jgi:ATP-dependent helicase/nuclease subunit B